MTHKYQDAKELYEEFMGFEPTEEIKIPLYWPDRFSVIGRALNTLYLSDKEEGGGDGTWIDFTHDHPTPCFLLCNHDRSLPPFGRWLAPPPGGEFATLGYCLEVSFFNPELGEKTLDFRVIPAYPYLGADPSKGLLCIAFPWGGDPLVIWGPSLRVEQKGIVG